MAIKTSATNRHRARLTSQGQITVPKAVRDALGARPGDDLEFEHRDGAFVLRRTARRSVLDFAGIASASARRVPRSSQALDGAITRTASDAATARELKVQRQARRGR